MLSEERKHACIPSNAVSRSLPRSLLHSLFLVVTAFLSQLLLRWVKRMYLGMNTHYTAICSGIRKAETTLKNQLRQGESDY